MAFGELFGDLIDRADNDSIDWEENFLTYNLATYPFDNDEYKGAFDGDRID